MANKYEKMMTILAIYKNVKLRLTDREPALCYYPKPIQFLSVF